MFNVSWQMVMRKIGISAILALIVFLVWNFLIVDMLTIRGLTSLTDGESVATVFALREITFLQAWGLLILCKLLFQTSLTTLLDVIMHQGALLHHHIEAVHNAFREREAAEGKEKVHGNR